MLVKHKLFNPTEDKKDPIPELSWKVKLENESVYFCAVLDNGIEIKVTSVNKYGMLNILPIDDSDNIGLDIKDCYISMAIHPSGGELDVDYAKEICKIDLSKLNEDLLYSIKYFQEIERKVKNKLIPDYENFKEHIEKLCEIRHLLSV